MNILLISGADNSLTQRVRCELTDHGHTVATAVVTDEAAIRAAVRTHQPELVLAPMLRTAIPEDVWRHHTCFVVHPGPPGDRGPAALDWALAEGFQEWGVTVLQAAAEWDAGDVWARAYCTLPERGKSDLYRGEVADAALEAVLLAVDRFASGRYRPRSQGELRVRSRPPMRQSDRRIDWQRDATRTVLRRLRAADSRPGVRDEFAGAEWYLHGGVEEETLTGAPGEVLATRAGAVCRATVDGAVWIPQLRARRGPDGRPGIKLPATLALGDLCPDVPELPAPLQPPPDIRTFSDLSYREQQGVGFLRFSFPGGAMHTADCRRLLEAYRYACTRPTSVLVLGPERDFFSNGIHLGVIEAAADPAAESYANLVALDDLVEAVLTTTDRLVVAALPGNAAAGGAFLALAADEVWCRTGVVLNPHYRRMGLYGSEYWTYTLPRRIGTERAEHLMRDAEPLSATAAERLGLVERTLTHDQPQFGARVRALAGELAQDPTTHHRLTQKKARRARDEQHRPLAAYRQDELARMRRIFDDPDAAYHRLRREFVRGSEVAGRG